MAARGVCLTGAPPHARDPPVPPYPPGAPPGGARPGGPGAARRDRGRGGRRLRPVPAGPGPDPRETLEGFTRTWSRGDDAGAAAPRPTRPLPPRRCARTGGDWTERSCAPRSCRSTRTATAPAAACTSRGRCRSSAASPMTRTPRCARTTRRAGRSCGTRSSCIRARQRHPPGHGASPTRPARASSTATAGHRHDRAVVHVGVARNKVSDPDATARAMAKVVDVDAGAYARAIRRAGPQQFVEAVTLRETDFEDKQTALQAVPGLQTLDATAPLAPTRGFARAVLGTVGPATAEQFERLGAGVRPRGGGRPVRPRGALRAPARRHADAQGRHPPRGRHAGPDAAHEGRHAGARAAHDARPRRAGRGRDRARRPRGAGGARRGAAVHRRRARGGQPADELLVRPRARRPLRAGLDVQGGQHGGAAARRAARERPRRVPADDQRGRADVQELRGRGGRRRAVRAGLRHLVQHRVREPVGAPAGGRAAAHRARLRARAEGEASAAGRPEPGPAQRRPRRARRGDDRPGADRGEPAADGGRRGDRRRRALARAAARGERPARERPAGVRRRARRRCAR